ncbi:Homeobox-leucine zipper protein ATHB-17 [Striga hermonthica]|uniref:Homeobox-leucine zipper protein ATHB-17 n=1 Tax=Striga hermonthica TaxID=68872 RepID=A0A9N7RDI4_STRHE|nr:Homeobox-leucine zipper protein ATHB-17 [Striga hermonthica]
MEEPLPDHAHNSTCLDLTIATISSSSGENGGVGMKEVDINEALQPSEECMEEEEDDHEISPIPGPGPGPGPRKKLRLTKEQSRLLEQSFLQNHTLNHKQKDVLAVELKLKPRQVEVWFQNRRARSKTKQREMECEYLKNWFGRLTEENKKLQKEVRDMKAAPPHSTLTMCPRCQLVATTLYKHTISSS